MSYTYLLVKLSYISSAHAEDRDVDSDDDESDMVSSIKTIYFNTSNISTIFKKLKDVPFGDPINFKVDEEKAVKLFEERRNYSNDIDSITEEIGIYYEDRIAKYFICIVQVPNL